MQYLVQFAKCYTQTDAILVVRQCAVNAIEQQTDRCGQILFEALGITDASAIVPDDALMRQTPTVCIQTEQIRKAVRMQFGSIRSDAEHHAEIGRKWQKRQNLAHDCICPK